ncbi:MAG TPA: FG-GAP-like repeat-containing protein [Chitinophagales bacterium]|nr:FG-GAP-like repeat-containing protein [Chitinophagales bacterium]
MTVFPKKTIHLIIVAVTLLLTPALSFCQFVFNKKTDISVTKGNATLKFPWTGGFNNPQFSGADINNDGIKDLVVFDRNGNKVVTFLNGGTTGTVDYTHAPQFEYAFTKFSQWLLMDDFDCDGVPDVFTYNIGAADYYKGRYTAENKIEFDSVTFFGYPSFTGSIINVFISAVDIPAIADINNDGDLDVLTFELLGTVVRYYENQSQELTGTCGDTVIFSEYPQCWGDFYEPQGSCFMVLDSCGAFKTGSVRNDGAHTLLAYDEDGDGDKELLVGQLFCNNFYRLLNGGTENAAHIVSQDLTFPSYDKPYNNPIFPGSYYVDVDNDGSRDLLAAPNAVRTSENYKCIWLYKNEGADDSAVFHFITDTFLIDQTLDFGEGAYPAFFDYNADGLLDVVAGNYGYYTNGVTYRSSLALLENTGTSAAPSFRLAETDYASVSSITRKAVFPAFGDMDDDGDEDMIVGEADGFLHYYRNDGGAGNPASFTLAMVQMFDIDVGQFSAPFIYDINGDSLPDLLVGEKSGNVNYYENIGTKDTCKFSDTPTNANFGKVDVRIPGFPTGYSTPVISKLDTAERLYLASGSEEGKVRVYLFDKDSIYSGSFKRRTASFSDIDEGERTALAIADLNDDGKMEMVIGNYRGGLAFFSQSDTIYDEVEEGNSDFFDVKIFPNPAEGAVFIKPEGRLPHAEMTVELIDVVGKRVWMSSIGLQYSQPVKLPELLPGIYLLKFSTGNATLLKKAYIRQ